MLVLAEAQSVDCQSAWVTVLSTFRGSYLEILHDRDCEPWRNAAYICCAQVVGDLAQFMVQNNLTEASIVDQADQLSIPNR